MQIAALRLEPRHEAAADAGGERDGEVERRHRSVDRDVVEAREIRRREPAQRRDAPPRQCQSERAAGGGEQYALGQHLAQQPRPARAERRADGELGPTHRRAREQQVADVRAHHQRHESDDAEEYQAGDAARRRRSAPAATAR